MAVDALISASDLSNILHRPDVKALDATWILPGTTPDLPKGVIPGAQFFDIDIVSDLSSDLKHMLPSAAQFAEEMSRLGIKHRDHVICYDRHGVFSSPRLWWTFRMFGHEAVSVLDGGLPAWIDAGQSTDNDYAEPDQPSLYETASPLNGVASADAVEAAIGHIQIVDARPSGRFFGTEPEPRAGLRSGHIPQSLSLPFGEQRTQDGRFKPLSELSDNVEAASIDLTQPIITSCGSGITAAGLAFIFHRLGAKSVSIYDGSWSEWGASNRLITESKSE